MADKSQLKSILQDVRKMRRAVSLRQETDPEKVASVLEVILKEAILLKTSGFDTLGKGAVNELRNIRRDMIAGHVNAGANTNKVIGMYSHVLDTIDRAEVDSAKVEKSSGGGLGSAIIRHLPTTDTLAAALMTANPMMGYVAKIGIDFVRSRRQAAAMAKKEHDEKIANLRAEAERIAEEAKSIDEDLAKQKQEEESDQERIDRLIELKDELSIRLDNINSQLQELNDIWRSPTKQEDKLEKISDQTEDVTAGLERIYDQDQDKINEDRAKSKSNEMIRREADIESDAGITVAGNVSALRDESQADKLDEKLSAMLTGLWAGIGASAGTLIATLLSPFKKLFTLLGSGAKILKPLLRGSGILTAIMGIFDFVDGFTNAADILGKSEDQVSVFDRIRVGSSHILSGFITLIDSILDYVGLGFLDDGTKQEDITKKIFGVGDKLLEYLMVPINYIDKLISEFDFDSALASTKKFFYDTLGVVTGFLKGPLEAVSNLIDEMGIPEKINEIKEFVTERIDSAIEFIKTPFMIVGDFIESLGIDEKVNTVVEEIGNVFDDVINVFTSIKDGLSNWLDETANSVKQSWLGKGVTGALSWFTGDEETPVPVKESADSIANESIVAKSAQAERPINEKDNGIDAVAYEAVQEGEYVKGTSSGSYLMDRAIRKANEKGKEDAKRSNAQALTEPEQKDMIEEPEKGSSIMSSAIESIADFFGFGSEKSQPSNTIIAPTNNTNISNTTNVEGSSGVRNNDNTWRRTNNRNLAYQ